jgi:hypothetical protein
VFKRLKFPSTVSASNNFSNGATAKSYAQVVNDTNFPSSNNGLIYREKSNRNVRINSLKKKISNSARIITIDEIFNIQIP